MFNHLDGSEWDLPTTTHLQISKLLPEPLCPQILPHFQSIVYITRIICSFQRKWAITKKNTELSRISVASKLMNFYKFMMQILSLGYIAAAAASNLWWISINSSFHDLRKSIHHRAFHNHRCVVPFEIWIVDKNMMQQYHCSMHSGAEQNTCGVLLFSNQMWQIWSKREVPKA